LTIASSFRCDKAEIAKENLDDARANKMAGRANLLSGLRHFPLGRSSGGTRVDLLASGDDGLIPAPGVLLAN
jgi:CII-binding regulator of phage lambda lysogenization HflD